MSYTYLTTVSFVSFDSALVVVLKCLSSLFGFFFQSVESGKWLELCRSVVDPRLSVRWLLRVSLVNFQLPPKDADDSGGDGVKAHLVNEHETQDVNTGAGKVLTIKSFGLRNIPTKWVNQLLFLSIRPVWVYM